MDDDWDVWISVDQGIVWLDDLLLRQAGPAPRHPRKVPGGHG